MAPIADSISAHARRHRRFVGHVEGAHARRVTRFRELLECRVELGAIAAVDARTRAPAAARPSAIASPSPEPPPVTSATPPGQIEWICATQRSPSARREEHGRARDLGRLAPASRGRALAHPRREFRVGDQRRIHLGLEESGRDAVDLHVVRRRFHRERAGQHLERALARRRRRRCCGRPMSDASEHTLMILPRPRACMPGSTARDHEKGSVEYWPPATRAIRRARNSASGLRWLNAALLTRMSMGPIARFGFRDSRVHRRLVGDVERADRCRVPVPRPAAAPPPRASRGCGR